MTFELPVGKADCVSLGKRTVVLFGVCPGRRCRSGRQNQPPKMTHRAALYGMAASHSMSALSIHARVVEAYTASLVLLQGYKPCI